MMAYQGMVNVFKKEFVKNLKDLNDFPSKDLDHFAVNNQCEVSDIICCKT